MIGQNPLLGDIKARFQSLKLFDPKKVYIESVFTGLHHKFTFWILLASCILVASGSFFGRPIVCMQDSFGNSFLVRPDALNQYCYIASTFSVPRHFPQHKLGNQVPHLGVGPVDGEEPQYHNYYQWVPFVLLFQAILFYAPHYIWKNLEGGKTKNIVAGLNGFYPTGLNGEVKEKVKILAEYLYNTRNDHTLWGIKYVFCEVLYLVNVIGQIYFTDRFLGGVFLDFGVKALDFLNQDPEVRVDPLARIFPRMTKCTFQKFGPSGTIQIHDSLCLLALNIINEKIYIFLWFWFIILAAITAINLVYRLATMCLRSLRQRALVWLTDSKARAHIENIVRNCGFSDWLLLDVLRWNFRDQHVYIELLHQMSDLTAYSGTPDSKKRLIGESE